MTNCNFEPRINTTSVTNATICKWCGKEKFMHNSIPEQLNVKPLKYVYVAMHVEFAQPIVTSNTMESMFEAIDDYMGPNSKRLTWYPYDCKYPDSYQGHVEYRDEDDEIQTIKIYDVDFFNKQQ